MIRGTDHAHLEPMGTDPESDRFRQNLRQIGQLLHPGTDGTDLSEVFADTRAHARRRDKFQKGFYRFHGFQSVPPYPLSGQQLRTDEFEERAAISEFCGGLPRAYADALAVLHVADLGPDRDRIIDSAARE